MDTLGDSESPPELIDIREDNAVADTRETKGEGAKKVPITIITEFGNTTDIEKSLTVSQDGVAAEEWIPLANGCICCSIKDSGVAALESLVERQTRNPFDYILLETTGVADPGNIAPMFWMDEGLGSSIYLDGIVTVVDAKNILRSLDEPTPDELPVSRSEDDNDDHGHAGPQMSTAHLQISHADVLILNKSDLVTADYLSKVQERLASINALAKVHVTSHSQVPKLSGTILDLDAYTTFPPESLQARAKARGHSHLDPTISTLTIPLPSFDPQKLIMLENHLQMLLWEGGLGIAREDSEQRGEKEEDDAGGGYEIHRTKGYVPCTDGTARVVQGVREIFEIVEVPSMVPKDEEGVEGKLVFIGRNLEKIPRGGI